MKKLYVILLAVMFISLYSTAFAESGITGTVSYTGAATGPVVVAAFTDLTSNDNPSAMIQLDSPGSYTITGLVDGTYYIASAMMTQGADKDLLTTDPWGIYGTWTNPTPVTITGGNTVSGVNMTLTDGTAENPNPFAKVKELYSPWVSSQNWYGNYSVQFLVEDPDHKATSVTVTGPGITGSLPLDYSSSEKRWNSWSENKNLNFGSNPPAPPLTYTFTIVDSDSTTVKTDTVENFVTVFAANLSPSKENILPNPLVFSWTGVGQGYTYQVQLNDANWNRIWSSNDNLTKTSAAYTGPALTQGVEYSYWVVVKDVYENESFSQQSFVYQVTGIGSISGTVSYTGAATGKVVVAAFSSPQLQNEPVAQIQLNSPGSFTIPHLSDGTYYIASVISIPSQEGYAIKKTDPWGVYGVLANPTPVTVTGGGAVSGVNITLLDGSEENPNPFYEENPNGVEEINPSAFRLSQNFPNPFNPVTSIEFSVPSSQTVTLKVFNSIGEEVARLVNGKVSSGSHTITWNASGCASGLYFYRLEAGATVLTKKLLLMK